ncbi:MAG TPA: translation initiation factor IF-2 [Candidatus Paceibacterota bacterium]|nr:translation initiation factor IF-2 [Candidatus Paceibacterota bacterium]
MPEIQPQSNTHRPPIVVVLGHVDHGKTSLLDVIRQSNVVATESGGITQHIGAYQVTHAGKMITFLDTPGHEAFTAIRSRGTKVADVAILVVAADESVKPQTAEAIRIIKEEEIPFIVAINKIDKGGANVQKVKQDLAGLDVLVEDWGGTVPVVEVSAKEKRNIPDLLDMILLVAELEDLKEDRTLPAEGVIIESHLDKRRGYVATALVQKGLLSLADWIVAGTVVGKIKSMENFIGEPIPKAEPSQPVVIIGWPAAPEIGRQFRAAYSKDEAMDLSAANVNLTPLFSFFRGMPTNGDSNKKYVRLVLKTDVASSLEAIDTALRQIKSDEVGYTVISHDIGPVTDVDVRAAVAGKGCIVGFRVPIESSARKLAEQDSVPAATFDIIYELIEYVRKEMANLLEPEVRRIPLGKVKILGVFKKDARFQVIGGRVTSGTLVRGALGEIVRDGNTVLTGKITQVQQNKEDVSEVHEGVEGGIRLEVDPKKNPDVRVGDILEVYEEEKIARTL